MNEQILAILKEKLENRAFHSNIDAETRRNYLKEELQYYILNFIYHNSEYSKWIMYGGSALRIIHNLGRMSVDLDFEISRKIENNFLENLKNEIEAYFAENYNVSADFLEITIIKRGLKIKFKAGKLIKGHASEWINIEIHLNHFIAPKTITEHRPISKNQLSFVITAYNMSALMASKIAAIFLREPYGIGKNTYSYKGRDIYDLLWYMNKKTTPDFDYLNAKLEEKGKGKITDIKGLFNKITTEILNYEKMDALFQDDLSYLFENPFHFNDWIENWRESYLRFLDDYKINTVTTFTGLKIDQDFYTDNVLFAFTYNTEDEKYVRILYTVGYDCVIYSDVGNLPIEINDEIFKLVSVSGNMKDKLDDKLKKFATLFYEKTEAYFKKTNNIVLGDKIIIKIIRLTSGNFNPKEEILLTKDALISCELDDLLK